MIYVGTAEPDDGVYLKGKWVSVKEWHEQLPNRAFEPVRFRYRQRETMEKYWAAAETRQVGQLGRVRLVASHQKEDRSDEPRFYVCNHLQWELSYLLGRRQLRSEWRRAMRTPKGRWASMRMNCGTKKGSADTGLWSLQHTAQRDTLTLKAAGGNGSKPSSKRSVMSLAKCKARLWQP